MRKLFGDILIPEEVFDEVVVNGAGKPGSTQVKKANWIKVVAVVDRLAWTAYHSHLGSGESACLVLAKEAGADLLIVDDRAARLEAQRIGLNVIGIVGVLLRAAELHLLEFPTALDDLLSTGFRLS